MSSAGDHLERLLLLFVPMLIVLLGCSASMLRLHLVFEVLDVLTAWTCASVPLAVLIGHCVLTDD